MLLFIALSFAANPTVHLDWKGNTHQLSVVPPIGTELAPDAPSDLQLEWTGGSITFTGAGAELSPLPTPDLRAQPLRGTLNVTLCSKSDGACTPTSWTLAGTGGAGRKGQVALTVSAPVLEDHTPFNHPADATIEAAFARAASEDKPLLLDFSAVWCPPCNLLSAEVLHAAAPPEVLNDYVVAVVDVDHPSSFALKSRYAVGGYPTVVVADPDGTERSRTVGYPGKKAFIDWLGKAAASTDSADIVAGADSVSPERALELAWVLLQDRRTEDAAPFVERGSNVDNALARRVRAMTAPSAEDARWLLSNDLEHIDAWFAVAIELKGDEPELSRTIAREAIRRLDGPLLADAFYVQGEITEDPRDYEAAASALRTAMRGDPEVDRGHITWLAQLTAHSDLDSALGILDEARERWPDEPTWDLSAAYLLTDAGRHEEALAAGQAAQRTAWGDNALRAALATAKALVALERPDDVSSVIDKALAAPAPDEAVSVRTHRYRTRLEALRP